MPFVDGHAVFVDEFSAEPAADTEREEADHADERFGKSRVCSVAPTDCEADGKQGKAGEVCNRMARACMPSSRTARESGPIDKPENTCHEPARDSAAEQPEGEHSPHRISAGVPHQVGNHPSNEEGDRENNENRVDRVTKDLCSVFHNRESRRRVVPAAPVAALMFLSRLRPIIHCTIYRTIGGGVRGDLLVTMRADLVIVADRGAVKAYEVDRTTAGGPALRLVADLQIVSGHERWGDVYADETGAFPNGGTNGEGNSIAERMDAEAEQEMKSFRDVARDIIGILEEQRPTHWVFAAPPEINTAILDGLPRPHKDSLIHNLPKDLVNTPADELPGHFDKAEVF